MNIYKADREKCWSYRDKYWNCLDKNNDENERCRESRKEFEKFCSKQWVKHFDRRREFEKFKEQNQDSWELPEKK